MKKIRTIELFSGIGAQLEAVKELGLPYEQYKTSEWKFQPVLSYKEMHKREDTFDYSASMTPEELTDALFAMGISANGNEPMLFEQIKRKPEVWKRNVYNSFCASNNLGSITGITGKELEIKDTDQYTYLMTYSFPCQDLSLAGKQRGMDKGSGSRSSMLWEVERLLNETEELPQVLLMENVPQVHSKKNKENFNRWLAYLKSRGYQNIWFDMNATERNIAQNRNRCFMVSLLKGYEFTVPKAEKLTKCLKDYFEESVDEKYYVSDKMLQGFLKHNENHLAKGTGFIWKPTDPEGNAKCLRANAALCPTDKTIVEGIIVADQCQTFVKKTDVAATLMARDYKGFGNQGMTAVIENKSNRLGGLFDKDNQKHQAGSIWDPEHSAPTLDTMKGGYRQPLIPEEKQAIINKLELPVCAASRGRYIENSKGCVGSIPTEQKLEINKKGTTNTLTTIQKDNLIIEKANKPICLNSKGGRGGVEGLQPSLQDRVYSTKGTSTAITASFMPAFMESECPIRIRRLTPKECWRLMGFPDSAFEAARKVNSDTQLYEQAGNSIVVDCLKAIIGNIREVED